MTQKLTFYQRAKIQNSVRPACGCRADFDGIQPKFSALAENLSTPPQKHDVAIALQPFLSILRASQASFLPQRTGGRVAEGARLERVYTGNRIEGSNPSLSAIFFLQGA